MKYTFEIMKEYEDSFKGLMILGAKDSNLFVDTLAVDDLEQLNAEYINNHFPDITKKIDEAYQRGLDDAWEAARKVAFNADMGGLSIEDLEKAFDCLVPQQVFKKYTAQQAIDRLKAYEEQKADEKIKVGDIVDWSGEKYIVSYINDDGCADLIYIECGSTCERVSPDCFTRTGKHFDIDKILEEMKE